MRVLIFILFVLAFGKVGTQAYIRQDSAKQTIIDAYREHALAACRQYIASPEDQNSLNDPGSQAYRTPPSTNMSVDLMIGNQNIDVRLWQTSHARWSARYRDPFILVKSSNGATVCEYDVRHGSVYARGPAARPASG